MTCSEYQVGTRIEAVRDFEIEEALARRDKWVHEIQAGDLGEVLRKLALGNNHSMIVMGQDPPEPL
jgi:hypothetical protein